ncbi:MAG: type II and III secretion system protein [Pseudomonadota bacterium]
MPDDLDREMDTFVREYIEQSHFSPVSSSSRLVPIKRLDVSPSYDGAEVLVSAHLDSADVQDVLERILREAGKPYRLEGVTFSGEVTVLFSSLPLVEALNIILAPTRAAVVEENGTLLFSYGSHPNFSSTDTPDGGPLVRSQISLQHIDATIAIDLLGELQESGSGDEDEDEEDYEYDDEADTGDSISFDGVRPFNARRLPGRNVIYLSGSAAQVHEAIVLLRFADRERPHVIIEALVLEADSVAIKRLGSRVVDGMRGDIGGASFLPGSSLNDAITFSFLQGAANPAQLTAMVELLTETEHGRVISRPYASTLSHETANISIVQEEYVIVEEEGGVRATMPITAGISLEVKPVVLDNESIRVELNVESSEFHSSANRATNVVDRSKANTIMDIKSGQTIIVGGLYRRQGAQGNAGIPVLRNAPGINLAFSQRAEESSETEVIVYLTPHIWWMDAPPSAPTHDINRLLIDRPDDKGLHPESGAP